MTTYKRVCIMSNLFNDPLIIPWGIGQKVLQGLIITVWNSFCHTFHVLLGGLDQPSEVLSGDLAHVSCTQLKYWRISAMKVKKMRIYAPEGAVVMSSSFAFCSIGLVGYLREVQCPIDFVFS